MKINLILLLFSISLSLADANHLFSQSNDVRVHDPVMIRQGDTYYIFCTGMGITVYSSPDREHWTLQKPVFNRPPQWTDKVVEGFKGHIWAPDISLHDGKYFLYYAVSAFGKNTSAIGLAVNATLDPDDKNFKWEDRGIIIQSIPNRDLWNAIDPNLITDEKGNSWLAFGSFWEGIKLVRLNTDLDAIAEPQEWYTIAKRDRTHFTDDDDPGDAAIEAPFIFKKDSMYYLFVSWDYCCRGENSTYKVVVGRSDKVMGPYLDKDGKEMKKGGGSLVIEGNKQYAGAGHNGAYTFEGKDYIIFHAYDSYDKGHSKLKIAEISWDDGWPVVDKKVLME